MKPSLSNHCTLKRSASISETSTKIKINREQQGKERSTMVVRLHPGHLQKISSKQECKPVNGSSCVKWTGDVHQGNKKKPICGLEITFSSVPQDVDIKLIPDIQ